MANKPFCVVAFAAHPDDAELSAGGTLLVHKALGHTTGIVNLTKGELGTRGTVKIRAQEAAASAAILGVDFHLNLGLPDGGLLNTPEQRLAVITAIRATKPDVILCNSPSDRHPDHGNAATLVKEAAFLAGLQNINTSDENGKPQAPHRPSLIFHYIQDYYFIPSLVIDISTVMEKRMEAIFAFKSQFHDPSSKEPATYISSPSFMEGVIARTKEMGRMINVSYGEGFIAVKPIGASALTGLL